MPSPLVEAHIEAERRLRVLIAAMVERAWRELGSWDRSDVRRFTEFVVPAVLAAQRTSVALTEAYLARALERQPVGVETAKLVGAAVRNGTPPEGVYERPFVTLWSALKDGHRFEDAFEKAALRATSAAEMDTQLSMRATVAEVSERDPAIGGFRRVTDGDACALCRIASTQRYTRGDLMPIHNRCGCSVQPIVSEDPGRVIDPELLSQLRRDGEIAKITAQRQAKRARGAAKLDDVAVHEHGELGPVLTSPDHHFTSQADL